MIRAEARTPAAAGAVTLADMVLLGLLLAAALAVARVYVGAEDYFYFWDYDNYQAKTFDLAALLAASPGRALAAFSASLADDYNMVPSAPLVPVALLLGESRWAYIAGVTALYLVPFALATGAVATRLVRGGGRPVFWGTAALTLAVPGVWPAALRGYPDVGGATLLAGALALFLGDRRGEGWGRLALAGGMIGLAVVFRRHLAYAAVALLALAGTELLLARLADGGWRSTLKQGVPRALVLGLGAAAVVALVVPDWAWRALTSDYGALYASYLQSPASTLGFLAGTFGAPALALAALGYALGIATRRLDGPAARLVLGSGALFVLVWVGHVRLISEQFVYPAALVVALGIAVLTAVLWARDGVAGRAAAVVVVLVAATTGAVQLGALGSPGPLPAAEMQARPAYPLRTSDRAAVEGLIRRLVELGGTKRPILVAASSFELNADLLRGADWAVRGRQAPPLRLLVNPDVDSRDPYPAEVLLAADLAVAVTPWQHHLPPAEQDVVRTMAEQLAQGSGFGRYFRRLPGEVALANGAVVTLFERVGRPDLPGLVQAVHLTIEDVGAPAPPGGDLAWLEVDPSAEEPGMTVTRTEGPHGAATLRMFLGGEAPPRHRFLYYGELPDHAALRGRLDARECGADRGPVRVAVVPVGEAGAPRPGDPPAAEVPAGTRRELDLRVEAGGAPYLLVEVSGGGGGPAGPPCKVRLRGLWLAPG